MKCIDCALFDTCNDRRRIDRQVVATAYVCKEFIVGTGGFIFMLNGKYLDTMLLGEKTPHVIRIIGDDKVAFTKVRFVFEGIVRYIFVSEIK